MPTFRTAPDDAQTMLREVVADFHPELAEAGVRIKLLSAHARRSEATGEPVGVALKLHGYPCLAIAKIMPHEKRVAGTDDAQISIDGDRWDDLTEPEQRALLDHEINHFALVRTKPKKKKGKRGQPPTFEGGGEILLDDCHRPRLKMRLHDVELGAFRVIAERHGENAPEVKLIRQLVDSSGQLLFPWCADLAMAEAGR